MPESIGQNARWLEFLDEYGFAVQHLAATKHANADCISRRLCLNRLFGYVQVQHVTRTSTCTTA